MTNNTVCRKFVWFGNVRLEQEKCPKCEIWQFKDNQICCECGFSYSGKKIEKKPTEYRSEPLDWRNRINNKRKEEVYQRDEYFCQYCGIHCYESYIQDPKSVVIDHLIPFIAGGDNSLENLITSCRRCNNIKSDKVFKTFLDAKLFIQERRKNDTLD